MKNLITLDDVCKIAKVSKATVYRRVKLGSFPKPQKVNRSGERGPKKVNRWERGEVMGWLLKGNDPNWMKQPVKDIKAACAKVDKAPVTEEELAPELNDYEPVEEPPKTSRYLVQAVLAALLAGIAVRYFNAG